MKTLLSKEQAVGLHRSVEKMNHLASRVTVIAGQFMTVSGGYGSAVMKNLSGKYPSDMPSKHIFLRGCFSTDKADL
jgi:hypothetical protein